MLENQISEWLSKYLLDANLESFIIGVSGGIDSAVVSTLCASTGIKTIVVSLPIHQFPDQLTRANNHIKWLKEKYSNVESHEIDLSKVFDSFKSLFDEKNKLALANSRSRLRMTALYQIAAENKGIVVGTGNKVEDFGIGFFTKYGDGGVDISPIGDLLKTEVWDLGKRLEILNEIIVAKPTDGLWEDDRNDEDQIGATYSELEWAMQFKGNLIDLTPRQLEIYTTYQSLNRANYHKMSSIPVFKKSKSYVY
jgi:NAD+ synthase